MSKSGELCLSISAESRDAGRGAVLAKPATNAGDPNDAAATAQLWVFEGSPVNGGVGLVNRRSDLLLGVREGKTEPGIDVLQWQRSATAADQQWIVEPTGDGTSVRFTNKNSGLYLTAIAASAGAGVVQEPLREDPRQLWRIETVK
jgi:hypothetical protein